MKGENDMTLKGRSFLTLLDFTPAEIAELLALAAKQDQAVSAATSALTFASRHCGNGATSQ